MLISVYMLPLLLFWPLMLFGWSTSGHEEVFNDSIEEITPGEGLLKINEVQLTKLTTDIYTDTTFLTVNLELLEGELHRDHSILQTPFGYIPFDEMRSMWATSQSKERLQVWDTWQIYIDAWYFPLLQKANLTLPGAKIRSKNKDELWM